MKWQVEFIANGETQVIARLTDKQIQAITKLIENKAV